MPTAAPTDLSALGRPDLKIGTPEASQFLVSYKIPGTTPVSNGSTTANGTTAPTASTVGTTTANISTPASHSATVNPPVVVTSSAATKDLANKKAQVDQFTADTQQHQQALATPVAPPAAQTSAPTTKTEVPQTFDEQIDSLLGSIKSTNDSIDKTASDTLAPIQTEQEKVQTQFDNEAATALSNLKQIASGTYPLSPSEQSLLTSTAQQYGALIQAQTMANKSEVGQMTELMASLGIATTAPTQAIGLVHATIDAGNQKIADLNAKMATSLATLQQGFQENDYRMISDAWDKTSAYLKDRRDTLKDLQKAVTDAATQQKKDNSDYVKTALTTIIDSTKFDYQQKQDAIDNALRLRQINETQRHDLMLEAAKGTGGSDSTTFTKTQINKGAANAQMNGDEFSKLDYETKNYFINSFPTFTTALNNINTGKQTVGEVRTQIQTSNLPQSVKDILDKRLMALNPGGTITPASGNFLGEAWNNLTHLVGL